MVPPGVYIDVDGVQHQINTTRWVLNQGDLYDFIQWLKLNSREINNDDKE